jgi:hemerythrin
METYGKAGWNTLVGWNKGYEIGNAYIDGQHRHLVGLLVNLKDFIVDNGLQAESGDIGNIVKSLADYTQIHFSGEQALMAKHSYPELNNHIRLHSVFVQAVDAFAAAAKAGKAGEDEELHGLYDFLLQWLINHILQEDRKFAEYLQGKGLR